MSWRCRCPPCAPGWARGPLVPRLSGGRPLRGSDPCRFPGSACSWTTSPRLSPCQYCSSTAAAPRPPRAHLPPAVFIAGAAARAPLPPSHRACPTHGATRRGQRSPTETLDVPEHRARTFHSRKPLQKKVLSAANAPRPCAPPCAPHKTAGFQPRAARQGLRPPPSSRGGAGTGSGRCPRRLSTQPCWCPEARTVPTLPTTAMCALCGGSPEPLATSPTPGGPCAFPVGLWHPGERLPLPQALNQGGRHPVTGTALPVPSLPSTGSATARSPAVPTGTARAHVSLCHRSWGHSHHFHGSCCNREPKPGAPPGPAAAWAPPPLRHHPAALP